MAGVRSSVLVAACDANCNQAKILKQNTVKHLDDMTVGARPRDRAPAHYVCEKIAAAATAAVKCLRGRRRDTDRQLLPAAAAAAAAATDARPAGCALLHVVFTMFVRRTPYVRTQSRCPVVRCSNETCRIRPSVRPSLY